MTKESYLALMPDERSLCIKELLQDLVYLKKKEHEICKRRMMRQCPEKFKLEQRILQIIEWEKNENE